MPPVRYQLVPSAAAAHFDRLPAPVQRLARLCDGTRTLAELSAGLRLPHAHTSAIVERLSALGVVTAAAAKRARQRKQTPPDVFRWLAPVESTTPPSQPQPERLPEPAPVPVQLRPEPAFTDEEESFFSSSIDHLVADEFSR